MFNLSNPEMNKDIYDNGLLICVIDGTKESVKKFTEKITNDLKLECDWYYIGEKGIVKTLAFNYKIVLEYVKKLYNKKLYNISDILDIVIIDKYL